MSTERISFARIASGRIESTELAVEAVRAVKKARRRVDVEWEKGFLVFYAVVPKSVLRKVESGVPSGETTDGR